jgi:hypothetical protein
MNLNNYSARTELLAYFCVILATFLVVIEYWLGIKQFWVFFLFIPGIVWYFGQYWNIAFIDALMLIIYTLLAALIVPSGGSPFVSLLVILAALSTWQLSNLSRRLRFVQDPVVEERLFRKNVSRLSAIVISSLFLGSVALLINLELHFWTLLALALLAILGLSRLVSYINQQGN